MESEGYSGPGPILQDTDPPGCQAPQTQYIQTLIPPTCFFSCGHYWQKVPSP
jgi:hypothetical protein